MVLLASLGSGGAMQPSPANEMQAEVIQVTSKLEHLIPERDVLKSSFLCVQPTVLEMEAVLPALGCDVSRVLTNLQHISKK